MARLATLAVLRAVGLASYRELRSFHSITGQNFFYLVLAIALQPESAYFFGLILGTLLFFPLSSDPIEKIPEDRRKLWPLDRRDWLGREPEASSKVTLALAETLRGLYDGSYDSSPAGCWEGTVLRA